MSDIDQLTTDQKAIVDLMQKGYDKYKRESYARRTKTLVQSKLKELQNYWKDVEVRHHEIQQLDPNQQHPYFQSKYFEKVKRWTDDVLAEYKGRLQDILKEETEVAAKKAEEVKNTESIETSSNTTSKDDKEQQDLSGWQFEEKIYGASASNGVLSLIGGQTMRIQTLRKLIENIKKELQPKWYYEFTQWTLQEHWAKISLSHEEILHQLPEVTSHVDYFDVYDNMTIEYNNAVLELRQGGNMVTDEMQSNVACTNIEGSNFRLPRVNIPHFDGDYKQWATFRDIYTNVIHNNNKLGKAEKMQFLKNHLKGEAAKIVRHLNISDSTYDLAWEIICNRFSNKRVLFTTQMELFLNQPKLEVKSASGIKQLHDTTKECLHSISNLGIDITNWGPMIVHVIRKKFDNDTRDQYENYFKKPRDLQSLEEVYEFLETRFQSLEANPTGPHTNRIIMNRNVIKQKPINSRNTYATIVEEVCNLCKGKHTLFACTKFENISPEERLEHVRKNKLCYNCLRDHAVSKCSSKSRCKVCHRKHNSKLHEGLNQEQKSNKVSNQTQNQTNKAPEESEAVQTLVATDYSEPEVLLATALILVKAQNGTKHQLRALIDQGSQASFISEKAAQILKLKKEHSGTSVFGMGMADAGRVKGKVQLKLYPHFPSIFKTETPAFVLNKLTGYLPNEDVNISTENHLRQIVLADPKYNKAGAVDIILGGAVYADIILDGLFKGQKSSPIAQRTEFGWILSGCVKPANYANKDITSLISNVQLDERLKQFWETENICEQSALSEENQQCEEEFERTHRRNLDGTYSVMMPFKKGRPQLGDSRKRALARLFQLEKKFTKDEKLAKEYSKFMREYLTLGHMAPAKPINDNREIYYLPHQPVFKNDSTTTKLRVVFDASAKSNNGVSLNDVLCIGPKLQQDITHILIRWRMHRVVFTADVEKMYRQILVDASQQDFQKILWRFSRQEPVKEYNLKTVTYGTAPAPYLAIKTLQQLAKDEQNKYPEAAKLVLSDFYVDDLISGSNSLREAKIVQNELIQLLGAGGFKLRKWTSNRQELLQQIPEDLRESNILEITDNEVVKALGIYWKPTVDKFTFKAKLSSDEKLTKRAISSAIATLFDPLGWISPIIITAKLILQQLWSENKNWDEPVGDAIKEKWLKFKKELPEVENMQIPRWSKYTTDANLELHGFCDASERAYAAVVYCRVTTHCGVTTTLLLSKTKVAKLKEKTTLPRLELNGAVLLSRLINQVKEALGNKDIPVTAWSDSTIALAWIKGNPEKWPCYVSNRVSEINRNIGSNCWFHVKSGDNPADLGSRGVSPISLKNNSLWWTGPKWLINEHILKQPPDIKEDLVKLEAEKEAKAKPKKIFTTLVSSEAEDVTNKYSSIDKLVRIFAYCRRFIHNSRAKKFHWSREIGDLKLQRLKQATTDIVRCVQLNEFSDEIQQLRKQNSIRKSSTILPLNPFLDKEGLLRVGGRLKKSSLPFERKHPIILPYKSQFTKMVIENSHKLTLHGGQVQTLAHTRYKYWIIKGQSAVKQVVRKCIRCFKYAAKAQQQLMGELPSARVGVTKPFLRTGIDYAGPLTLRMSKGRGAKTYKGHFIVFICLVTKAIHLEVATDLTAQAFIAAFTRFIGRRGRVAHLYSDNATYFTAANKILQLKGKKQIESYYSEISNELVKYDTEWHFIPPAAPHMGGIWENCVKLVKNHLKRIVGDTTLTFEELTTTLIQIEACLNSRPLCPLNDDPDCLDVLTPGHFLTTDAIMAPPEENLSNDRLSMLTRWQLTSRLSQDFWHRWSAEYLSQLQKRPKWTSLKKNLKINDVVLITNEQLPPCHWSLGRIIEVHPGSDELVRVVTLKLKDGHTMKRPITKIAPLPIEDNEDYQQNNSPNQNYNTQKDATSHNDSIIHTKTSTTSNVVTIQSHDVKRKLEHVSRPINKTRIQQPNSAWFDEEGQQRSAKYAKIKARPSSRNILTIALLVCLVLPVARGNFTIIRPDFGIYAENIGDTQIKRGSFRIEVQTSLKSIIDDKENVGKVIKQVSDLCKETEKLDKIHCNDFLRHLRDEEDELKNEIQIVEHHMQKHSRQRRGILGSLMQTVFGVNDEVYSHIEKLSHNQEILLQSATHQTNIMISTLARTNETESLVIKKLNIFSEKLNKSFEILEGMKSFFSSINRDELHIHFLMTFTAANNYITEVKERNQKLLNALYKHGSILEFLQHARILELIQNATSKLPSTVQIVSDPSPYVEMEFKAEHISIYGFFDITEIQNYTLLHLTAIPSITEEDQYTAVTLSSPILAVNYNDQKYFELSEYELRNCIQSHRYLFYCHPTVVKKFDMEPNCIIDELYQRHEGQKCSTQTFSIKTSLYKKLFMSNTWLFVANKPKSASLQCNGVRNDVTLNGTGIIKISKGCILHTKEIILKADVNDRISVHTTYHKSVNLSTLPKVQQLLIDHIQPESVLKTSDQFFRTYTNEETQLHETLQHFTSLARDSGIAGSCLIISMIGVIVFLWRRKVGQLNTKPTPAPRSTITDFSFNNLEHPVQGGENVADNNNEQS